MKNLINKELLTTLLNLYKKKTNDDEFEFIIRTTSLNNKSIGFSNYYKLLNYLSYISDLKKLKLEVNNILDINFSSIINKDITNIRISIEDINNINSIITDTKVGIKLLIKNIFRSDPEKYKVIVKDKKFSNIVDIEEYNIRARLSKETIIVDHENLKVIEKNVLFRFKQRTTLKINNNISIDLTLVNQSKNLWDLNNKNPQYELEIESSGADNNENDFNTMLLECEKLIKIIEETNYIISNTEKNNVLKKYYTLNNSSKKINKLDARKPVSLEISNIPNLANKYSVTDKADGNRYFLFIIYDKCYLISYNLGVFYTGLEIDSKYNNTILDGEYLKIKNTYTFLCFDCLFISSKDLRSIPELFKRLNEADKLIKEVFVFKSQKGHDFNDLYKFPTTKTKDSLAINLEQSLKKYMETLNHDILNNKDKILVRRKYFVQISGIDSAEIYRYAKILWNKYVYDTTFGCLYHLDGLIFQPNYQTYVTYQKHPEFKLYDYKWKPKEHNSIDFYITFDKDENGNHNIYYDNTIDSENLNKNSNNNIVDNLKNNNPYKIVHLHVGMKDQKTNTVIPTLFMKKSKKHLAFLFFKDGQVRDEVGNVLQDNSIVEFTYNNNINIPQEFRWIPRNIRFDKTERTNNGLGEYGNYYTIAKSVWNSINNPISINDFETLGNGLQLAKRNYSITQKENAGYYQNIVTIAMPMKKFHNYIKNNLINTYTNSIYFSNNKLSILDLACGRGGDINKFYFNKDVSLYVGVDIDNDNLVNNIDGAIIRYKNLKKKNKNSPNMYFINGDAGALLTVENQKKAIGKMSSTNENLIQEYLIEKKFDIINCQFAVHYLLKNDVVWNNFVENINNHLKDNGYLLLTTFDADRVDDLFKDNKTRYDSTYIDENGKIKNLFTIIKKYDNKDKKDHFTTGYAINYTNILMFAEDVYHTEYLVDKKFIEKELNEKCNMVLVDTDLFENQYNNSKDFFTIANKYEKKKEYYTELINFYNLNDSVNKSSHDLMKLNRYYVFKKKPKTTLNKGGALTNNVYQFKTKKGYLLYENLLGTHTITKAMKNNIINYSLFASIYYSLLIKKKISDFYKDIKTKILLDTKITDNVLTKLSKKITTNILIIYDIDNYVCFPKKINKNNKTIILLKYKDSYYSVSINNKTLFKYDEVPIFDNF